MDQTTALTGGRHFCKNDILSGPNSTQTEHAALPETAGTSYRPDQSTGTFLLSASLHSRRFSNDGWRSFLPEDEELSPSWWMVGELTASLCGWFQQMSTLKFHFIIFFLFFATREMFGCAVWVLAALCGRALTKSSWIMWRYCHSSLRKFCEISMFYNSVLWLVKKTIMNVLHEVHRSILVVWHWKLEIVIFSSDDSGFYFNLAVQVLRKMCVPHKAKKL